jgi:ribose transport system ATP-binding protein
MGDVTTAQLVAAMVGRELAAPTARVHRRGDVVLDLDAVAGANLPRAATLQLHAGEVLGLAGLVGAGRTELLRAVFGLDPVVRGNVRVAGSVGPAVPVRRWAQRVGMVSEDRKGEGVMLARSLAENVLLPVLSRYAVTGVLPPSRVVAAAEPFLRRLAVRCASPRQAAGELSGGNQQKLTLARLFAADCHVLLLDEPTRGIDVGARADIYAAIAERAQQGAAVLVASSQLPELLQLCDRIAVVRCGVVLPPRPVHELDETRLLAAMTGASA